MSTELSQISHDNQRLTPREKHWEIQLYSDKTKHKFKYLLQRPAAGRDECLVGPAPSTGTNLPDHCWKEKFVSF